MKISVYSSKGSAGKTPISANIALDKDFCIGTNEAFHIYDNLISDNKIIALHTEEAFPQELIEHDIDIVFDLAGSISKLAVSISSALTMSDFVIVPIYNEYKSLVAGLNTINQIQEFNQNIIVVATKLQKQKNDIFKNDWMQSEDFRNIRKAVKNKLGEEIPVLPLKFSKVFDNIFEEKKSIKQLMEANALAKYSYKDVASQFDEIYKLIGI
jgi:cellulose biosynthesis protein BcsQ